MYIETNLKKWDEFHAIEKFRPMYPNESVIRFVKGNFPEKSASILDLGCGSGRHVVFMAKEGYKVTGYDFSKTCLEFTRGQLNEMKLEAKLMQGSVTKLPFEDGSFDGVVCFGVLLYLMKKDIIKAIKEMHRVMKRGGKAFIVVRSTEDLRYGMGEEVEQNTFIIHNNSTNEQDMVMHFFNKDEVYELFNSFSNIKLGIVNHSMYSLDSINSDYLISLTK